MTGEELKKTGGKLGCFTRAAMILVSIMACIAILEMAVRISGVNDQFTRRIFSRNLLQMSDNPVLVYEHKPGGYSRIDGVDNRISSQGLRDREFDIPKPRSRYRILAIGDSITYGLGVRTEETYTKVLEKMIEETRQDNSRRFEVLNLGVNGYKTGQEVEYLKQKGLRFEPDLVILAYNLNDPGDFSRELPYFRNWQNRQWATDKMTFFQKLRGQLAQYSDLAFMIEYRTMRWRLGGLLEKGDQAGNQVKKYDGYFHLYENRDTMDALESAFDKLQLLASEKGFRVMLVVFPLLLEFDNYRWKELHQRILVLGSVRGFITLDLLDVFRSKVKAASELQRRPDDFEHPNTLGHRIAAQAIFDVISGSKFFEKEVQ